MAFIIIIIIHRKSAGISCESSAWQTIHMKYQDLISMKNKKKRLNVALSLGALRD